MPWIETVAPEDATGRLAEAYGWQARALGRPTEFTQLGSLAPELVHARLDIYRATFGVESRLSARQRAIVVYLGSILNRTPHCASLGEVQLRDLTGDDTLARLLDEQGFDALDSADAAVARYTRTLTLEPGAVVEADIAELREVGFDDLAIFDLNSHVAHINYTNRVANGLGLLDEQDVSSREAFARVPADPR